MDRNTAEQLEQAREFYQQRQWSKAYDAFVAADRALTLGADDLELLAMSAYLVGRDEDYLAVLERAHEEHGRSSNGLRSARCAFWLGRRLLLRGDAGRATAWFARATRIVEGAGRECAEQGFLLVPVAEHHLIAGDCERAYTVAAAAVQIGERVIEPDLIACARHIQGRALLQQGELARGLALLDETMLLVMAGKLSPLMTGLLYCSVIEGCQRVYAVARAREWTLALSEWCETQSEMVAFTGSCLVNRAEIMRLHGEWHEAFVEAQRACERCTRVDNRRAAAAAHYQRAEVHRLRGQLAAAEEAYRNASQRGCEPQPGLALLRLAQGRTDLAAAAIRRVVAATKDPLERTKILPAHVEIMLACGDEAAAHEACRELEAIAARLGADVLAAMAAHARGTVELARGDGCAALGSLRESWHLWQQIDAPYPAARARVLIGVACRMLGDEDGALLELDAARAVFDQLGAAPDIAHLDSIAERAADAGSSHRLTRRELQVLRLIASGKTNKLIAGELSLSEKTVDRHVSNIFMKLSVPSRAAATAYAYRHQLV
jgi:DNA-binding CsgD family transcriptional regulator